MFKRNNRWTYKILWLYDFDVTYLPQRCMEHFFSPALFNITIEKGFDNI